MTDADTSTERNRAWITAMRTHRGAPPLHDNADVNQKETDTFDNPNPITINVNAGDDARLERIERLLRHLIRELRIQGEQHMADLSALQAEIENNTSVTGSAAALVQRLADQIEEAGGDQEALDALVDQLRNNDTSLADAVAANTPGAELPPVEGTEVPPEGGGTGGAPPAGVGGEGGEGTEQPELPTEGNFNT